MRFGIWLVGLMVAGPAQALTLGNCDKVEQVVEVHFADQVRPVRLAPGQNQYVGGIPTSVEVNGHAVTVWHYDDEFCVWHGDLFRQRDRSHRRK